MPNGAIGTRNWQEIAGVISMRVSKIVALLALISCNVAVAQIETVVRAVETAPSNIRFPSSENGVLSFRPCSGDCDEDYVRVTLTAATTYQLNGRSAKFAEFRQTFMLRSGNSESYALVSYDVDSRTVTAVEFAE